MTTQPRRSDENRVPQSSPKSSHRCGERPIVPGGPAYRALSLKFGDEKVESGFEAWVHGRHWRPRVLVAACWLTSVVWCAGTIALTPPLWFLLAVCCGAALLAAVVTGLAFVPCMSHERPRSYRTFMLVASGLYAVAIVLEPVLKRWAHLTIASSSSSESSQSPLLEDPEYLWDVRSVCWYVTVVDMHLTFVMTLCQLIMFRRSACIGLAMVVLGVATTVVAPGGDVGLPAHRTMIALLVAGCWLILALASRFAELAKRREYATLIRLGTRRLQIESERSRQEGLLRLILPAHVVALLQEHQKKVAADAASSPLKSSDNPREVGDLEKSSSVPRFSFAQNYLDVGLVFVWIPSSPAILDARDAVKDMARCFRRLDAICAAHGAEKLRTFGNVWVACVGCPVACKSVAQTTVRLAMEISRSQLQARPTMRIGLAAGPVTAGVIGASKPRFDLWGDTMNVAARMLESAEPGTILATERVAMRTAKVFTWTRVCKDIRDKGMMPVNVLTVSDLEPENSDPVLDKGRSASNAASSNASAMDACPLSELVPDELIPSVSSFEEQPKVDSFEVPVHHFIQMFRERRLERKLSVVLSDLLVLWNTLTTAHTRSQSYWGKTFVPLARIAFPLTFISAGTFILSFLFTPWYSSVWWKVSLALSVGIYNVVASVHLWAPCTRRRYTLLKAVCSLACLFSAWSYLGLSQMNINMPPFPIAVQGTIFFLQQFGLMTWAMETSAAAIVVLPSIVIWTIRRRPYWVDTGLVPMLVLTFLNAAGMYLVESDLRKQFLASTALNNTAKRLTREKESSEELLLTALPLHILSQLRANPREIVAEWHQDVSVLVVEIVSFTEICERMSAQMVVRLLDRLLALADGLVTSHGLTKLRAVGETYVAVSNVSEQHLDHVSRAFNLAVSMLSSLTAFNDGPGAEFAGQTGEIRFRVALHRGPVLAGVLLMKAFGFDCWGDTMAQAERVASLAQPNSLVLSSSVFSVLDPSESSRFLFTRTTTPDGLECHQTFLPNFPH